MSEHEHIAPMSIEEARRVGSACEGSLYPPTNPAVLSRAIYRLYLSQEPIDRPIFKATVSWLHHIVEVNG
jgi:hypothetical protein